MRPGEFWEAMRAYNIRTEADRRHIGELVRGAALRICNLQLKKPIKDPRKFWPMPWDSDPQKSENSEIRRLENMTEEETAAEVEKFMSRIARSTEDGRQH